MTRADLLEQLSVERYVNTWWTPPPADPGPPTYALLMAAHEARLAKYAERWERHQSPDLRAVS